MGKFQVHLLLAQNYFFFANCSFKNQMLFILILVHNYLLVQVEKL